MMTTFSRTIRVSWHHNVSILDFTGVQDDGGGGDNWSRKTCKAPVKSSPPTNHHPNIFTGRMPFLSPNQQCQSTEGRKQHTPQTGVGGLMRGLATLPQGNQKPLVVNRDVRNRFFNFGSVLVRFLKKTRIRFGMNLVRFGLQKLGSVRIVIYY